MHDLGLSVFQCYSLGVDLLQIKELGVQGKVQLFNITD
jgi:hypothetical protein